MSKKPFKFKQFSIEQDKCAMKVGTDGVLLGAWSGLEHHPDSILDVGTGTGLIALMLAQRSTAGQIDAIELDDEAYEQATDNFENSDWGDRLFCYHAGFDEFVDEMQGEESYDLIISNPPFHPQDFKSGNSQRDQARFADSLPLEELIEGSSLLLSKEGHLDIIIPFSEETKAHEIAKACGLSPERVTRVKGTKDSPVKRSLLSFTRTQGEAVVNELIIEIDRHVYTDEFRKLVADFYLKL